jgi:hypothetical protein
LASLLRPWLRDGRYGRIVDGASLQRKYVVLPVPEHVEPDGTIKEANNQIVEVVQ